MKNITLNIKSITLFFLAAFGLAINSVTLAHDQSGSLGEPSGASDYYLVQCSTTSGGETDLLKVRIKDLTVEPGGGKLSAVVLDSTGGIVKTASDPKRVHWQNGQMCTGVFEKDVAFGPPVFVNGGNGAYEIVVHKQKAATHPKIYLLEYHCQTDAGVHTGTAITVLQDH